MVLLFTCDLAIRAKKAVKNDIYSKVRGSFLADLLEEDPFKPLIAVFTSCTSSFLI